ncbi:srfAB [Symbiodinium sp. CCMP2592]|nr:srfAB [Symbiodinium sp. CCMP2592]
MAEEGLLRRIFTAVQEAPDATALLWYEPSSDARRAKSYQSYKEVWTVASQAAEVLRSLSQHETETNTGVGDVSPQRVGLMLGGGPALAVLELAVLLAGFALVPLDAEEPLPRLQFIMEDAGPLLALVVAEPQVEKAQMLLQNSGSSGYPQAQRGTNLLRDSELLRSEVAETSDCRPPADVVEERISHIFFTSGSTGRPKGCMCSFHNLITYCLAKNTIHQVDRSSIVLVASAHTFDPSLGDFFATWLAGATVALVPRALLQAALGLLNTYGVTECTVYQAAAVLTPKSSPRLLGSALPGTRLLLAAGKGDDPTACVEDGSNEHGELWIAGPQVGLGYVRRPDLTSERFRDFPGLGRCFRSGDLAAARDGGWQLLGRRDGMVKLRGRRVELGEVEEVLLAAAPEVVSAAAAVLAHPGPRLVLYCVLQGQQPADCEEVSRALLRRLGEDRLPPHMVPSVVIAVASLPMTGTGKVSRRDLAQRALPEDPEDQADLSGGAASIAAAWSEVLGVPVRSPRAHFLALGGDSLAALRVCQRLAKRSANELGSFGELLPEPLQRPQTTDSRLPAHLLSRPYLVDYLVHLQRSAVGADFKEPGSAGSVSETGQASYQEILQQAAGVGALGAVRNILRRSDVHEPATCIRTPLHAACMNGRDEVVRLLLEARVSPTSADKNGVQPIHLAAQGGSEEVLTLLITARAKLDATSTEKQTVLHFAARSGAPGAVLNLLMAEPVTRKTRGARASGGGFGLKIDAKDGWGRSALHWAVVNGNRTVVLKLLEAGADRNLRDAAGETPLLIAERRAQCRAQDRPGDMGASVFGDIATLLGGSASTAKAEATASEKQLLGGLQAEHLRCR